MPQGKPGTSPALSIGPLQIGGSAPTPDTVTIGDLQGEGTTVVQVISVADGKPHIDPAYVIQPGDRVYAQDAQGKQSWTTVTQGDDGQFGNTGWAPVKPDSTATRPLAAGSYADSSVIPGAAKVPTESALVDHYATQLNDPNLPDNQRQGLVSAYNAAVARLTTAVDTNTKAAKTLDAGQQKLLAQAVAAVDNAQAGRNVSVAQQDAYDQVRADPQLAAAFKARSGGGGASALGGQTGSFTQSGPGGSGDVNQTPVEAAVDSVTDDPRVRMAMKLGASLEGGLGPTYGRGDGGGSRGPFQINHNMGMHADISPEDSEDPAKAAQYMLDEYQQAVAKVPDSLWSSNPKEAARQAAFYAERPAAMYDQGRVDANWNQLFGGTGGAGGTGGTGGATLNGLPPLLGGKGAAAKTPARHIVHAGDTVVDDQGHVLFTAPNKPDKGDPMQFLQQQEQAIQYVQAQLAAGTMTTSDANTYLGAIKQQTAAGLAGTTPYSIWKDQQALADTRAQMGRDMLNNQMQANDTLTSTLLSNYTQGKLGLAGGNYNPMELASEETDFRGGNLGPNGTNSIAQALIDAVNPANPMPTIGQTAGSALGLPAPGAEPALGTPLGAPGASPAPPDQPQQEAA